MNQKIVIIGAGSAVFARNIVADIFWHEALRESELVLVDTDPRRLAIAEGMVRSICRTLGVPARIRATRDRRRALAGAQFVLCTMGVGGLDAIRVDLELPQQHGLKQVIGDTLGVGGVFRAARSIPELLRLCADMEELCPEALLLNYVNPMAMHCLAVARATKVRCVGLCHGVANTARTLRMFVAMQAVGISAEAVDRHLRRRHGSPERVREWLEWWELGLDPELRTRCAGINHMTFFLDIRSGKKDLYPELKRILDVPHLRHLDPVRFELFEQLGWFMAETSGHTAEYVPYFLRSAQEIKRMALSVSSYLKTCHAQNDAVDALAREVEAGRPVITMPYTLSVEYASRIINAVVTDQPFAFSGNVINRDGLIANLPNDACVEVPCLATGNGIQGESVGELPPQCAALIRTNLNVQDLAVRGVIEGNRERLVQAILLDPNTASQLTIPKIRKLCNAMFVAHASRLPKALQRPGQRE